MNNSNEAVIPTVLAFNEALNERNLAKMMSLVTPDTVYENTYPTPDGARYEGIKEVQGFWEDFFLGSTSAKIEVEEIFSAGDRCVMRWTYHWAEEGGKKGHIRGVDVYKVEDGLIAEKLSYVKG